MEAREMNEKREMIGNDDRKSSHFTREQQIF